MVDYRPAWLTDELDKLLEAIGGQHQRKKRSTVKRLAEAATTDRTETETFKLPDVCSSQTWYGKYKDGERKPGWKDDPAIAAALEAATKRALWWMDQQDARRAEKRMEHYARAQEKLAELAYPAALTLGKLLGSDAVETARKAANDILDRGNEDLASKARVIEQSDATQRVTFDLSNLPDELLGLLAHAGDDPGAEGGGPGGTE